MRSQLTFALPTGDNMSCMNATIVPGNLTNPEYIRALAIFAALQMGAVEGLITEAERIERFILYGTKELACGN